MRISSVGIALIQHFEGLHLEAYQCSAGVWTIGYGHTRGVKPGDRITEELALELLYADLLKFEQEVTSLLARTPTQNEFDALVSFAFNVGSDIDLDDVPEGLGDSTLLRKYNAGDIAGCANEFSKWVKAKGKILAGLVKRRDAEELLFRGLRWQDAL